MSASAEEMLQTLRAKIAALATSSIGPGDIHPGLLSNIDEALEALRTGKDGQGQPVTRTRVAEGLHKLVKYVSTPDWLTMATATIENDAARVGMLRTYLFDLDVIAGLIDGTTPQPPHISVQAGQSAPSHGAIKKTFLKKICGERKTGLERGWYFKNDPQNHFGCGRVAWIWALGWSRVAAEYSMLDTMEERLCPECRKKHSHFRIWREFKRGVDEARASDGRRLSELGFDEQVAEVKKLALQVNVSSEDEGIVRKLVDLASRNSSLAMGDPELTNLRNRIREIGEEVNAQGGFGGDGAERMRRIARLVTQLDTRAGKLVELYWDRINLRFRE